METSSRSVPNFHAGSGRITLRGTRHLADGSTRARFGNKVRKVTTVLATTAAFLGFVLSASPLSAQSPSPPPVTNLNTIQIEPTFQELIIDSDQASVSASLLITNSTSVDQNFSLFAVDIDQVDSEGRVILADRPLSGADFTLAEFIVLPSKTILVPAGQAVTASFTVANSGDLSPGGHYAAVVARLQAEAVTNNQQILPAVSSFILVRKVGGEQYHLSLSAVEELQSVVQFSSPAKLQLQFSNQGNIHTTPRGTIAYTDIFNRKVYSAVINQDSLFVLPGTQRTFPVTVRRLRTAWPIMLYRVQIEGRSDPGDVRFGQTGIVFIASPIALGVSVIGLGLLLVIAPRLIKRRRKHASA